ncbi:MAG: hypothetical protein A3F70_02320 [Acidobacteria bacterium RIFCSPLOWO2_12_FULL_67_14]|nr:MAG: hypothetical protein A3F70_02320 [Acidobacteria bacterium RIFCSPLOWO2_12_FULL_67_14]
MQAVPDRSTVSTFLCPRCDGPLVPINDRAQDQLPKTAERYSCPHGCGTFEYVYATKRFHELVATASR